MEHLTLLESGEPVALAVCAPADLAGATVYRAPDGRWLAPAFRGYAVDLGRRELPEPHDEAALADVVLEWVETVRAHDWSEQRGAPVDEQSWLDLPVAMVRIGWGPTGVAAAWEACRRRPYSRDLPTAAGWAGGGWVVPAVPDEPVPAFARPVLEARGLLRWGYITRWSAPAPLPDGSPPTEPDPSDLGWADVLSRLRADHYTEHAAAEAEALALEVLAVVGLGPRSAEDAEAEPLPAAHVAPACRHDSGIVRAAAWFLLRADSDHWLGCQYGECQHHWAVEAEEDQFEQEEVLDLAGRGVADPVDAAYQRRRLLTMAFGDITDVPLAGAGDIDDFIAFYDGWVAAGRPEDAFADAARDLRGD